MFSFMFWLGFVVLLLVLWAGMRVGLVALRVMAIVAHDIITAIQERRRLRRMLREESRKC